MAETARIRKLFALLLFLSVLQCENLEKGKEPSNQGSIVQLDDGNLRVYLNNRGFSADPNINENSMFAVYVFKKGGDFKQSCPLESFADKTNCVDSMGFSNEPGFFGYNSDFNSYSPSLQNSSLLASPVDGLDCYPFSSQWNCGINHHPIRKLDTSLNQQILPVFAADSKGYPSTFQMDYNDFQSLNHVVEEGERYDVYVAVHYRAIRDGSTDYYRFLSSSSIFKRPILPDLISPKVTINIKLSAEGPTDTAGNHYDIPDYSTWFDPYKGCRGSDPAAGSVVVSEINWAGSESTAGSANSVDEFLEIYNRSGGDLNIGGWKIQIETSTSTVASLDIPLCTVLPGSDNGGTTLDERILTIGERTDLAFSKLTIVNDRISLANTSGRKIRILSYSGNTIDTVDCTATNFEAVAGSNSSPKRSMRQTQNPPVTNAACNNTAWNSTSTASQVESTYAAPNTSSSGTLATPGVHP